MKKSSRIIAVLIAALMILSILPAAVTAAGEKTSRFEDVATDAYYFDAVMWAFSNGVTTGTTATKFGPATSCTRGQVVTFLWRAMGEPVPTISNPFKDIKTDDYYYSAVLWAVENGITNGTSENLFSPERTCSVAHIVTFIYRAFGEPGKTGNGEWFADAINWANNSGLIEGTESAKADVSKLNSVNCPRADVVTILYRYKGEGTVTVYVSPNGNDATGDGSYAKPYATVAAARDAVRKLDKSQYKGITVFIANGEYSVKETLALDAGDSGTESCPVIWRGEGNVSFVGGNLLSKDMFKKAEGTATCALLPASVKDNILMLDLKTIGYTQADIDAMYSAHIIRDSAPIMYVDGELQNIARYPNDTMVYFKTGVVNAEGRGKAYEDTITLTFDADFMAHAKTWSTTDKIYTDGRLRFLWRPDRQQVVSFDFTNNTVTTLCDGGYEPGENMPLYFYNIPEELDIPGEYYIDREGYLYYYPTDGFYTGHVTLSGNYSFVSLNGTEYVSFKNMMIESFENVFSGKTNNFTLEKCTVRNSGPVSLDGMHITIKSCELYNLPWAAITLKGGDNDKLILSENLVTNCIIHDWGQIQGLYEEAVEANGCGMTVSHCTMYNAPHEAYTWNGAYNIFEYNEVYNVCTQSSDAGALYSGMSYADFGSEIRYNYIHDIGLTYEPFMNIEGFYDMGCHAIYWDDGESFQSATYNVVENVKGNGVLSSGRNEVITNNLFISCGYALDVENRYYAGRFIDYGSGFGTGSQSQFQMYGMENKTAWKEAVPELYKISWDIENAKADDPYYFGCPGFITIKDNYVYYDKATAKGTNWGVKPYNIHESVYSMNEVEDPTKTGRLKAYTSKRTTIDVREAVEATSSVTGITLEIFDSIGAKLK